MPGFAGLIGPGSPDECKRAVGLMRHAMTHRAEYISGTCHVPALGAYVSWTAHPGSFAAHQCSLGPADATRLIVAGEPRYTPLDCGHKDPDNAADKTGRGQSNLLAAYSELGTRFVDRLNGMFSGVLIDVARREVMLFNDRYGMERVYFATHEGVFYFASEAKALLAVLPTARAFDDDGLLDYLTFGSTHGGRTLFKGVSLLPGGSIWRLSQHRAPHRNRYFDVADWENQTALEDAAFEAEFEHAFDRILPAYLDSDRAIGLSLTGGLDTRMILAALPSDSRPECYTYAGAAGEPLDVSIAAKLAKARGLTHHTLRIDRDFLRSFGEQVDRTVWVTDGTAGALAAHELHFSALAREIAPIRLTGNFGSEVLRSMSTLKPLRLASGLLCHDARAEVSALTQALRTTTEHPVTRSAFREIPSHLFGTLAAARSELVFRTPYLDNELVKLAFRASSSARQSPHAAMQLVHHHDPLLARIATDRGVSWGASPIRSAWRRLACAVAFKLDYLYTEGMPRRLTFSDRLLRPFYANGLLGKHKFLPYRDWFRAELREQVSARCDALASRGLAFINPVFVRAASAAHAKGQDNFLRELGVILTLEALTRVLAQPQTFARSPIPMEVPA